MSRRTSRSIGFCMDSMTISQEAAEDLCTSRIVQVMDYLVIRS